MKNIVKRQRLLIGKSQRELGKELGVSHVFLGNIERGVARIPRSRCLDFAKVLKLSIKETRDFLLCVEPITIRIQEDVPNFRKLCLYLKDRLQHEDKDLTSEQYREISRILEKKFKN